MTRCPAQAIPDLLWGKQGPCSIMDQNIVLVISVFPYILQPMENRQLSVLSRKGEPAKFSLPHLFAYDLLCPAEYFLLPFRGSHNLDRADVFMGKQTLCTISKYRTAGYLHILFGDIASHTGSCAPGQK